MDYKTMLEHSFHIQHASMECAPGTRLSYLADSIFDFTTYDDSMSELFGKKAVEVCDAILNKTTFDYIKEQDNYAWFLLMCNMPFFHGRLSWGTSIRGAWWDFYPNKTTTLRSHGIFKGDDQLLELVFSQAEWDNFIRAVLLFAAPSDSVEEGKL